ncbi:MAG TPA: hypothetical protein VHY08_23700 [Bacillota bacterium]|nr:hypothetical protein [Bacillota bacterium]
MVNDSDYKPSYLEFMRYRISFEKNYYFMDGKSFRYIELDKTRSIAYFSHILTVILTALVSSTNWFLSLNLLLKIIVLFPLAFGFSFILETLHWFYAKFDVVKEEI